jgi:hypothetical protein
MLKLKIDLFIDALVAYFSRFDRVCLEVVEIERQEDTENVKFGVLWKISKTSRTIEYEIIEVFFGHYGLWSIQHYYKDDDEHAKVFTHHTLTTISDFNEFKGIQELLNKLENAIKRFQEGDETNG